MSITENNSNNDDDKIPFKEYLQIARNFNRHYTFNN